VGRAFGTFNEIAVWVSANTKKTESVTTVVSTPSKASRQLLLGREKVYGPDFYFGTDRLANSISA